MKRVVSVTCPHCSTRYDFSIELQRLRSMGLQAKCTRCDGSFDIVSRLREQLARGAPQHVARIQPVKRTVTPVGADEFAMSKDDVDIESLNEDDLLELDGDAAAKAAPPPPPPGRDDGPPDLLALANDDTPSRPFHRSKARRFSGGATVVVASPNVDEAATEDYEGVELSPAEMNALLEMARSLELSDEDVPTNAEQSEPADADLDAAFAGIEAGLPEPAVDDASPLPDPSVGDSEAVVSENPTEAPATTSEDDEAANPSEADAPVSYSTETSDANVMLAPDVDPSLPIEFDDGSAESNTDHGMQPLSRNDSGPLSLLDLELPSAPLRPLASMAPRDLEDSRMATLPTAPASSGVAVAEEPWPPSAPAGFPEIDPDALFDASAPDPEVPVASHTGASGPVEAEPARTPAFVLPTEPHWLDLALPPFAANDGDETPGEPALVWLLREGA